MPLTAEASFQQFWILILILADSSQLRSCVIEIEDTCPGIAPNVLKNVFEPLYTNKAAGTGLGLSICKQIIEKHQGNISVKSQVRQGTIVTIVTIVLPAQE